MLPVLPNTDCADSLWGNAIFVGEFCVDASSMPTRIGSGSDRTYLGRCENGKVIVLSGGRSIPRPPLRGHVSLVVSDRANPEMLRIEARRVVAAMQDTELRFKVEPKPEPSSGTVNDDVTAYFGYRRLAISHVAYRGFRPYPAARCCDLTVCQQALAQNFSRIHLSPSQSVTVTGRSISQAPVAVGSRDKFSPAAGVA